MQHLTDASTEHQADSDQVQLWVFYSGLLRDEGCEMLPSEDIPVHVCTALNREEVESCGGLFVHQEITNSYSNSWGYSGRNILVILKEVNFEVKKVLLVQDGR